MKRWLWTAANGFMLLAFLFSAVVQYNDPDPIRWIMIYFFALVVCIAEMRRQTEPHFALAIGFVALIWASFIVPHFYGHVHFADLFAEFEMKNEQVEFAREAGGLYIVAFWMFLVAGVSFVRKRREERQPAA